MGGIISLLIKNGAEIKSKISGMEWKGMERKLSKGMRSAKTNISSWEENKI